MLAYQLRLHLIVVIFGFTGILGKLILLPSELIVLYRMVIATLALAVFLKGKNIALKTENINAVKWLLTGVLVGLHWYFFFESIKQSTVSVALVCLSSSSLFTAVLEPLVHRKKIQLYELGFGATIILGMTLVLRFEFQYAVGILFGVLSAFLASLFTVLNSKYIIHHRPSLISLYELLGGGVFILVVVALSDIQTLSILPSFMDVIYLLILGIVATALAFVVSIGVMKKLTPFTVSLTINLEPLYGIILAIFFFGQEELMSSGFYIGFAIILGAIALNAIIKRRIRKGLLKIS